MAISIKLTVNGKSEAIKVDDPQDAASSMRYAIIWAYTARGSLGLGQCGACTVHVDGKPMRSCRFTVASAAGRQVLTLEGLGTPRESPPTPEGLHRRASGPVWLLHQRDDHAGEGAARLR